MGCKRLGTEDFWNRLLRTIVEAEEVELELSRLVSGPFLEPAQQQISYPFHERERQLTS